MAVSSIEGRIADVQEGRSPPFGNATIYKRVTWTGPTGERELRRFFADRSMNPYLEPGRGGQFYTYTTIDQRGLFAYRDPDGAEVWAWPGGPRFVGTLLTVLGSGLLLLTLVLSRDVSIIGVLVTALGIAYLIVDNQNRKAGEELFDSGAAS
ncbi:MAG: hypothetical protein AAGE05_12460 [Pseudomonadota bacterium]